MRSLWQTLTVAFSSLFCFLFGDNTDMLIVLITFMIIDYISGVVSALINKTLNSAIGFKGIFKKLLMFLPIIIANLIDVKIISGTPVLVSVTTVFYCVNESISILENLAKSGVPIPKKLKTILAQLKEKAEND